MVDLVVAAGSHVAEFRRGDVHIDELHAGAGRNFEQVAALARDEAIDADDGIAGIHKRANKVTAEKARGAGYKCTHYRPSATVTGRWVRDVMVRAGISGASAAVGAATVPVVSS